MPEWPTSASRSSFETSAHRSTQYDGAVTPQQRSTRGFTPSDAASPLSTRAATESGDDTETEAGDERMSNTSDNESMAEDEDRTSRRKKRENNGMRMEVDG